MDIEAVAQFITDTALIFAPDIAGAVLALSITLIFLLVMRDKFLNSRSE